MIQTTLPQMPANYDIDSMRKLVRAIEQALNLTERSLLQPQLSNAASEGFDPKYDVMEVAYTATSAVTVPLPPAFNMVGRIIYIKDTGANAATNNITLDADGTDLIDGAGTYIIDTDNGCAGVYSDGEKWLIISKI